VKEAPESPSARRGQPVNTDLESLLLRCLGKTPAERPADAAALLGELECCTIAGHWTTADAAAWWALHEFNARSTAQVGTASSQAASQKPTPAPDTTMAYEGERFRSRN
jgi:serine/threonine-protein kinase